MRLKMSFFFLSFFFASFFPSVERQQPIECEGSRMPPLSLRLVRQHCREPPALSCGHRQSASGSRLKEANLLFYFAGRACLLIRGIVIRRATRQILQGGGAGSGICQTGKLGRKPRRKIQTRGGGVYLTADASVRIANAPGGGMQRKYHRGIMKHGSSRRKETLYVAVGRSAGLG